MSGKFFLDTNIFVYSFDSGAPKKSQRATQLILQAIQGGNGIVSYQVVQEFFNVALRRFAVPMTTADAEQYLSTTSRPLLAVHSSHSLYGEALRVAAKFKLSWYDSVIVASAWEGPCEALYSEGFLHGQRFGDLQIVNPFL
jgi:predicted nucleic acid-binding protein